MLSKLHGCFSNIVFCVGCLTCVRPAAIYISAFIAHNLFFSSSTHFELCWSSAGLNDTHDYDVIRARYGKFFVTCCYFVGNRNNRTFFLFYFVFYSVKVTTTFLKRFFIYFEFTAFCFSETKIKL